MTVDYETAVTDRSAADLARFRELDAKRFSDMTEAERAEWLQGSKAAYNAADLNRVGGFVLDLKEQLHEYVGTTVSVDPKTNWEITDIPTIARLNQYIQDIHTLRDALVFDTPEIPDTVYNLTLNGANAIEQLCVNLNAAIARLRQSGFFCDELYSGEEYI